MNSTSANSTSAPAGAAVKPGHMPRGIDGRLIVIASAVISLWSLFAFTGIWSQDGVFLAATSAFVNRGLEESLAILDRPGIPLLLGSLHLLTGASLQTLAALLQAFLYLLLSYSFVTTVSAMGGNRRVQLLALAVILLHPLCLHYRSPIPVEVGYWSCVLLACQQLIFYSRQCLAGHLIKWLALMSLASVFRAEALGLMLLMPLGLWLALPLRRRSGASLQMTLLSWSSVAFILAIGGNWLISPVTSLFTEETVLLAYINELHDRTVAGDTRPESYAAITGAILSLVLVKVFTALSAAGSGLLLLGKLRGAYSGVNKPTRTLISVHIALTLLYLFIYQLSEATIAVTEAGLAAIFLLLYLPFALDELWRTESKLVRWGGAVILLFICLQTLKPDVETDTLNAQAKNWFRQEPDVGGSAGLATNNIQIAWQVQQPITRITDKSESQNLGAFLAQVDWQHTRYVAIFVKAEQFGQLYELARQPQLNLAARFRNDAQDWLVIMQNPEGG